MLFDRRVVVGGAMDVVGGAVEELELGGATVLLDGGTNELSDVDGTDVVGGATEVLGATVDEMRDDSKID